MYPALPFSTCRRAATRAEAQLHRGPTEKERTTVDEMLGRKGVHERGDEILRADEGANRWKCAMIKARGSFNWRMKSFEMCR